MQGRNRVDAAELDEVEVVEGEGERVLVSEDRSISPGLTVGTLMTSAMALAACGGGGSSGGGGTSGPSPTPTPTPPVIVMPSKTQAARFLSQSTMGATKAETDKVASIGYDAWLTEQFNMARPTTHWDWLVSGGFAVVANRDGQTGFDPVMWRQLIASPDQLRQRVTMALLDFLVVGIDGVNSSWRQFAAAAYVDVLADNAFGNFRTLIDKVSTSAAMGYFLTFIGNRKADTRTGSVPDENYAREVMQLFTLGLYRLNADGSTQTGSNGQPMDTYTQDDITGLARVFTGWNLDSTDNETPDRLRRPMVNVASQHETGVKTFLGTTIPAGTTGPESLRLALDAIFAHANVGPFIAKQLIQRLVTSNPPASYVQRIAAVFANDGAGVRGNLRAVIRAILLDDEARNAAIAGGTSSGKLREPIRRLVNWARAFDVTSPSNAWAIGDTTSTSNRLGQSPGRSPSVFNFYRPGYAPPNTPISTAGLVAPEFQIANEPTVVAYINYIQALINNGTGDVRTDYTAILALAADSAALVDEVDLLLGAGLATETKTSIRAAVDSISATATNGPLNRVKSAILLVMAAPEYLIQK